MQNSRLILLFKSLTNLEKKQFGLFVNSPYLNSNLLVIRLYEYIVSALDTKQPDVFNKRTVYKELWGNRNYDTQLLSTTMSQLMRSLEDFLAFTQISKRPALLKGYLLHELSKRNLDKHFLSNSRELSNNLKQKKINDSEYYFEQYSLEKELDFFYMKNEVRKSDQSLQRMTDNLDIFFLSEKLKNLCEMVNRKNIIGITYDMKMAGEILHYVKTNLNYFHTVPAVFIYYKILLSLTESENQNHFDDLMSALEHSYTLFSKEEAQLMFIYMRNYCIKKINGGKLEYLEKLFSINEKIIRNELIFEGNNLNQWDYKNIVSTGLKLNKFDWTKEFIEKYKDRIAPEFRENAYEYNSALLHFSKNDYKSALKLLQKVEFTDVFYHIGSKSMLLKIYFELEEVESFYSLVEAFKVYLVRNKNISAYQKQMNQNLLKYTKQVFNIRIKEASLSGHKKEAAIKKLKEKITLNKNQADFSWLLEKIIELS